MKWPRLRATLTGLILSVVALDSSAQGGRRAFGMLAIGPAVPLGEFGDGFGTGWDVMAGGGVALRNVPLELRATLNFGSFKSSGHGLEGTSKPRGLNCDVLYRLGSDAAKVRPYVLGGAGFYSVKYSSGYSVPGEGSFSESDNGLSFGAGGGVMAQTGSVSAFAEARYTSISGSGHSHLPLFVGVRFGSR